MPVRGLLVTKPLDDITVIEIDNWMAAPSAGAILADLGAKVIKIEPLSGDPMRGMGRPAKIEGKIKDHDFQFDVDNRGKKSIQLDLTKDDALEIVKKLCAKSEVFMCNLLAKRQEKFGLDPASLSKINPRIVHATLTGYGTQGPDAWRPGYDVTAFFGRSGMYDAMREGDEGIVPMARTAQGDHTTGLAMAAAIMAALRQAEKTGKYQSVETSLFETAVWTQATDYSITAVDNAPLRKRARAEQLSATANRYPCGDGSWIVFNMPEPFWWPRFADALGKPEWKDDERFLEGRDRYKNMSTLVPMIDEILMTKSRDQWGQIMDQHGIIWGPVLGLHEVVKDPQADAINLFPKMEVEGVGDYRTVRIPMNFHTFNALPSEPAPTSGQHTKKILLELGYSSSEINVFTKNEIVK